MKKARVKIEWWNYRVSEIRRYSMIYKRLIRHSERNKPQQNRVHLNSRGKSQVVGRRKRRREGMLESKNLSNQKMTMLRMKLILEAESMNNDWFKDTKTNFDKLTDI